MGELGVDKLRGRMGGVVREREGGIIRGRKAVNHW